MLQAVTGIFVTRTPRWGSGFHAALGSDQSRDLDDLPNRWRRSRQRCVGTFPRSNHSDTAFGVIFRALATSLWLSPCRSIPLRRVSSVIPADAGAGWVGGSGSAGGSPPRINSSRILPGVVPRRAAATRRRLAASTDSLAVIGAHSDSRRGLAISAPLHERIVSKVHIYSTKQIP